MSVTPSRSYRAKGIDGVRHDFERNEADGSGTILRYRRCNAHPARIHGTDDRGSSDISRWAFRRHRRAGLAGEPVARIGPGRWKLAYSAVSLIALVLVVWGYGAARANPVIVWAPPSWGRHAAALLTVIGFVLIAAAYVPATRIKAALGHPMTAGVAFGHWGI